MNGGLFEKLCSGVRDEPRVQNLIFSSENTNILRASEFPWRN